MALVDIFVIVAYLAALLFTGFVISKRIHNAKDLFAASGQSPWWLSGISAYMTMFSSGTFVVWGGIAYRSGLVGVTICMTYGISALLIGYKVAAKWRASGVSSAGEFVRLRYGSAAFSFFTWMNILSRVIGVGVAIYSISVLVSALISVDPSSAFGFLSDPETGNLSVSWAIMITGIVVVGYTIAGGLWAVMITDILQFIVLGVSVVIAVPLLFMAQGGIAPAFHALPEGHLNLLTSDYTLWFMIGWTALNALKVGGEWAFVQRSLSVRSPRDAQKANYLFGVVYLVSPILWLLPPLLYAGINPAANPEQAYILSVEHVLPAGLLGLMIAAMFSATASMADSEINVFSGALTMEIYARNKRDGCTDQQLVKAGRIFTMILGVVVVLVALGVPYFGGAERVVLTAVNLLVGPMIMPIVWALLSPRIKSNALWTTVVISFVLSFIMKFILPTSGGAIADWIANNQNIAEQITGLLVPALILGTFELSGRTSGSVASGWDRTQEFKRVNGCDENLESDGEYIDTYNNGLLIGYFIAGLAAVFVIITVIIQEDFTLFAIFISSMSVLAAALITRGRKLEKELKERFATN
ncbi:sodium:solute symporter family transporter [Vibrio mediterranei]